MTREDAITYARVRSKKCPGSQFAAYRCQNGQWFWGRVSEGMINDKASKSSIYRFGKPVFFPALKDEG